MGRGCEEPEHHTREGRGHHRKNSRAEHFGAWYDIWWARAVFQLGIFQLKGVCSKVSARRVLLSQGSAQSGFRTLARGLCRASCLSPLGGGTYSERLLDFTARGYLPIPRPKPICREMGLRISRGGGGAPPRDSSRARAAGNFGHVRRARSIFCGKTHPSPRKTHPSPSGHLPVRRGRRDASCKAR